MNLKMILLALLAVWNLFVFLVYAWDKRKAIRHEWRVPEKTLLTLAFAMGGCGALAGMYLIRHKTKHLQFVILVPLGLIFNTAVLYGLFRIL